MINGKITFFSNRALINALLQKPGYSRTPTYAAPPTSMLNFEKKQLQLIL